MPFSRKLLAILAAAAQPDTKRPSRSGACSGRRSSVRWESRSAPEPPSENTLARWFDQADRNRDGV